MDNPLRKKKIGKKIDELNKLLEEWEQFRMTVRDPGEKHRSENEIRRIREFRLEYENELAGGIGVNDEKLIEMKIAAKAIRRNNKRWLIAIFLILVCASGAYFIYDQMNKVQPDYNKYLAYLHDGDSLVTVNNFIEAKKVYKQALNYNPGDASVTEKIKLLDKADELIRDKKYDEAEKTYKLVINIQASDGLSMYAISKIGKPIKIILSWEGETLEIIISGGIPYSNANAPFAIEGIECENCVQWNKSDKGYIAKVPRNKVSVNQIKLSDSAGQISSGDIPKYISDGSIGSPSSEKTIPSAKVADNQKNSAEQFTDLVNNGDKLFLEKNYIEAKKNYDMAININTKDIGVRKKISDCENAMKELTIAASKNISKVSIKEGLFQMGTDDGFSVEGPNHTVKLNAFNMSKTEVTVAQYKDFCKYTGIVMPPPPSNGLYENNPMVNVNWEEAKAYCTWVGGRLPTEAEWEYAAKAGANTIYSGGNQIDKFAYYKDNSGGKICPVGKKLPNAWGLFDMTGNVSEWCSDWLGRKYYSVSESTNPKGPSTGKERVIRGGAYNSVTNSTQDGNQLRLTYRNSKDPVIRESYLGFRVVWDN